MKSSKVDSGKRIEERKKMNCYMEKVESLVVLASGTTRKIHRPCNSLKGGGDKIK